MRILILEDQQKTIDFLLKGLSAHGYAVDAFKKPSDAEAALSVAEYDLLIVDVNLPEKSGWDFVTEARSNKYQGIVIMLTALSTTEDKITGLDAGADDYVTKPFSIDELLARMRAQLRKKTAYAHAKAILSYKDLSLDLVKHKASRGDLVLDLSVKEFSLLEYFMRNPERPLSRAQIAEHVWNIDFDSGSNVIDVYINHLRKKLEEKNRSRLIQTVVGMGYELRHS